MVKIAKDSEILSCKELENVFVSVFGKCLYGNQKIGDFSLKFHFLYFIPRRER